MNDSVTRATEQPYAPVSRAEIADQLRVIWSEVLYTSEFNETDNFVALGGDSIAATLCTTRIRATLGVDVAVTWMLLDDTDFAMLVDEITALQPGAGA